MAQKHLPTELIIQILEAVPLIEHPDTTTPPSLVHRSHIDYATFGSLAHANNQFSKLAEKYLYNDLVSTPAHPLDFARLSETLLARPDLAERTKYIYYHDQEVYEQLSRVGTSIFPEATKQKLRNFAQVLSACVNVEQCIVRVPSNSWFRKMLAAPTIEHRAPQIKKLTLGAEGGSHGPWKSWLHIDTLPSLCSFQGLESLTLYRVSCKQMGSVWKLPQSSFASLKELHFRETHMWRDDIVLFVKKAPGLKVLDIECVSKVDTEGSVHLDKIQAALAAQLALEEFRLIYVDHIPWQGMRTLRLAEHTEMKKVTIGIQQCVRWEHIAECYRGELHQLETILPASIESLELISSIGSLDDIRGAFSDWLTGLGENCPEKYRSLKHLTLDLTRIERFSLPVASILSNLATYFQTLGVTLAVKKAVD